MKIIKFDANKLITALTVINKLKSGFSEESRFVFIDVRKGIAKIYGAGERIEVEANFYVHGDGDDILLGDDCNIIVDRRDLLDVVKHVGRDRDYVVFEVDDDRVVVRGDAGTFVLRMPKNVGKCPFTPCHYTHWGDYLKRRSDYLRYFSTKEFVEALNSVVYAAPRKDSTFAKTVIHIVNGWVLYGCSEYGLAKYEMQESYFNFSGDMCISTTAAKSIVDILNILGEKSGEIGIINNVVVVEVGDYVIGVLVTVDCEDFLLNTFKSVLTDEYDTVVIVEPKKLIDILKHARKIRRIKYVCIEVNPNKDDNMDLNFRDDEWGLVMSVEMCVKPIKVGGFNKAFDLQYLIDALKPTKSEYVALCCSSKDGKFIEIRDGGYRAMVMETV
jgi:hypothetical protein